MEHQPTTTEIVELAQALGRKFTDEDMDGGLMMAAAAYLKSYTGDFSYLIETRETCKRTQRLTKAQARGILNCLVADARRTARQSTPKWVEIHQALQALAGVCDYAHTLDNQGFNGVDAAFGHDLAERGIYTDKQAAAAYKMIRKYRGQLAGFGIDYDSLPHPVVEAAAEEAPMVEAPVAVAAPAPSSSEWAGLTDQELDEAERYWTNRNPQTMDYFSETLTCEHNIHEIKEERMRRLDAKLAATDASAYEEKAAAWAAMGGQQKRRGYRSVRQGGFHKNAYQAMERSGVLAN